MSFVSLRYLRPEDVRLNFINILPVVLLGRHFLRYMLSPVRLSVCLSVCRLSVTFVHPTQAVVIFGNFSTAFGTLAIR